MQVNPVAFKITLPMQKSEREDGWYITGIAAGTDIDIQNQRLSPQCIGRFVDQINTSPVPFKDWHAKNTIMAEMGTVEKAWLDDHFNMGVEVRLDQDHPGAAFLWKSLGKGKQYGMSVEGDASEYGYQVEKSSGKNVLTFDNVLLSEISATTKPIYTPSLGTVLRKAIDEAQAASVPTGDKTSMEVTPPVTGESTETKVVEITPEAAAAPANAPVGEVTVPAVEKAVSATTARDAKGLARLVKLQTDMNSLVAELGLSEGAIAATNPTAPAAATSDSTTVEKSESDANAEMIRLVKSALDEVTAPLKAEIEALKERIPETAGPGVLVRKSEAEEAAEVIAELRKTPSRSLRASLAAQHGEQYQG